MIKGLDRRLVGRRPERKGETINELDQLVEPGQTVAIGILLLHNRYNSIQYMAITDKHFLAPYSVIRYMG